MVRPWYPRTTKPRKPTQNFLGLFDLVECLKGGQLEFTMCFNSLALYLSK